MDDVTMVLAALGELHEDNNIPKNVRCAVGEVIDVLQSESDASIRVHSALNLLDNVSNDVNLESYTRTQVWSIVSMLERIQ